LTDLGEVRISGGGASSTTWLQIIADVMDAPVHVVGTSEAAAHGAALLAATGAGAFGSVAEAVDGAVQVQGHAEPSSDTSLYNDAYGTYRDLYPALRTSFHELADLEI